MDDDSAGHDRGCLTRGGDRPAHVTREGGSNHPGPKVGEGRTRSAPVTAKGGARRPEEPRSPGDSRRPQATPTPEDDHARPQAELTLPRQLESAHEQRGSVALRDVAPDDIAGCLRSMLGLDPDQPAPGELAARLSRPVPLIVAGLDAGAWIAWCLAGLPLFTGRLPTTAAARGTVNRLLATLGMLRAKGRISRASRLIRTSRKMIRAYLVTSNLYPWEDAMQRWGVDDVSR